MQLNDIQMIFWGHFMLHHAEQCIWRKALFIGIWVEV